MNRSTPIVIVTIVSLTLAMAWSTSGFAGVTIAPETGFSITWDGNDGDYHTAAAAASPPANLSTDAGATAFASGVLGLGPHTTPERVRDGLYGNYSAWIGSAATPNYVGINLGGTFDLNAIAWGRDNGTSTANGDTAGGASGQFVDRSLGTYTVQITNDLTPSAATTNWTNVGTLTYVSNDDSTVGGAFTSFYRHQYGISAGAGSLLATGVRLIAASPGNDIAIDELEVYGQSPVAQNGLRSWLRADGDVQTTGANVTQLSDHSLNNNHATLGIAPDLVPNSINGLSSVQFDTTPTPPEHMNVPVLQTELKDSDFEIFVVARSSASTTQFLTGAASIAGVGEYEMHLNGLSGARFIPSTVNATTDAAHPDIFSDLGVSGMFSDGRTHIYNSRVDGDIGYLRVAGMENGDTVLHARSSLSVDDRLTIGVRGSSADPLNGDLGEVLIYDRALSETERRQVERYLARKWDAPLNVASQTQGGVAFASHIYAGGTNASHQIDHLNDALYGNSNSWLGNNSGGAGGFVGVRFDTAFDISSLAFGRAADGGYVDRAEGTYTFQYTLDDIDANSAVSVEGANWIEFMTVIYDGSTVDPWARHQYDFATIFGARALRVLVSDDNIAIDELEVYGLATIPTPSSAAMTILAGGLCLLRRRCGFKESA